MRTCHANPDGYVTVVDGIERKTLVYGDQTMLCEFRLTAGKTLPQHKHPHEQTGYLISGHIVLTIGKEQYDMLPGSSWSISADVEHSAAVLQDSVAVEVFSPVRKDYLP